MPAVPAYEPMLAAYHRAFARELESMLDVPPVAAGPTVLDMACGDGAYTIWLADRVGESGRVVAVDVMPEFLVMARAAAAKTSLAHLIEFVEAPIGALPFDDGTFDLVWCAQSLYSLPEPVAAMKHMLRVVKPGGVVAVLEGDTLHHVILPWPIEVELSVRAAELQALAEKTDEPRKFYVGRQLRRVFREAGFTEIEACTFATDRHAPLGPDERTYFAEYLKGLTHRVDRYFQGPVRKEYDRLTSPDSGGYLLDDPDLTATCLDHLVWGRRPS